ncbi:MAG: sodium:solute symporter family transporter, partial [Bradymonadaceae bacterium]
MSWTDMGLWAVMLVYGLVMFALSPRSKTLGEFYAAQDKGGKEVGLGLLIGSVAITWLFAKSITNAANLGASYGIVGAVAYAGWYLSIPVAGVVIFDIRRRTGAGSLGEFVTSKYGRLASLGFLIAILIRLFNEIWSNTAVVAAYFGAAGSTGYYAAAFAFALLTLAYSWRGGLRSSVLTDALQAGLAVFLLVVALALVVPRAGPVELVTSGEWVMKAGVDLLLVGLLQSLSYPFHDPVLTDRGFIARPKKMLVGYLIAGVVAALFIVLFGLIGVHAHLLGIDVGEDAPLRVAQVFGVAVLAGMSVMMMMSAGSTLDSTLSSFARTVTQDLGGVYPDGRKVSVPLPGLARWIAARDPLRLGRAVMAGTVVIGSLPLLMGAAILSATTISGTMVLGLAPIFLLHRLRHARAFAFHFAFWPGVAAGVAMAAGWSPAWAAVGQGKYAVLLGVNLVVTAIVFAGFGLGMLIDRRRRVPSSSTALVVIGLVAGVMILPGQARAEGDSPPPVVTVSGEMMMRYTANLLPDSTNSAELYNLRLYLSREFDTWRIFAEPRFRQTPLRSFSPSNFWLQQAWVGYRAPSETVEINAGLLYRRFGLFWDHSWFGNLPYLDGFKLNPDYGIEVRGRPALSGGLSLDYSTQFFVATDGLNGFWAPPSKLERLNIEGEDPRGLPLDFDSAPGYSERHVGVLRLGPNYQRGSLTT